MICYMAGTDELISTREAADLLGVSVRHLRRLADRGDLELAARGLVDRESVRAFLAVRQGVHTRAWEQPTAWGAIALLSKVPVDWLGSVQVHRLRARLREMEVDDLVAGTRNRATVRRYRGHPAAASRIREDLRLFDRSVLGLVTVTDEGADGYVATQAESLLVERYSLRASSRGNFVLRATDFDLDEVARLGADSPVLVALDSASSTDPREREVARRALEQHLEQFQRTGR